MKPRLGFQIRVGMRVRVSEVKVRGGLRKEQLGTLIKLEKGIKGNKEWRGMPVIKLDSGRVIRGCECFWTKAPA